MRLHIVDAFARQLRRESGRVVRMTVEGDRVRLAGQVVTIATGDIQA